MNALDVISVQKAKDELNIDYLDNGQVEQYIKAAVSWVEKFTGYRLYQRTEVVPGTYPNLTRITSYPVNSVQVFDGGDNEVSPPPRLIQSAQSALVRVPRGGFAIVSVGYVDTTQIDPLLIQAVYKLITYFSENKDVYDVRFTDVRLLLAPFRRNATI